MSNIQDLEKEYYERALAGTLPNLVDAELGWATYSDGVYTSAAPLTLVSNTDTALPNNAASVIDSQKPLDVTTFYDSGTGKITGRNGDGIALTVFFKALSSQNQQWIDVWLDIGGIGELYRQTFAFPRGSGQERGILWGLPSAYTLGSWEANGATLYVRSNAAISLYGIVYNISRTHKAR